MLVKTRANAPDWALGDALKRVWSYICTGGKTLRPDGGVRLASVSWPWLTDCCRETGGMAKGGVDERPNGGEYDMGALLVILEEDSEGLKEDIGRVTTLVLELGRRASALLGCLVA